MLHTKQKIDELILKLRNLHVLLEEAVLRNSPVKVREIISQIAATANEIEELRQ
jgi:hypothetical protein